MKNLKTCYAVSIGRSDKCIFGKIEDAVECMIDNMDIDDDMFSHENECFYYACRTYLYDNMDMLLELRESFSIGEHRIERIVMTEDEFCNLPEFEGF